MKKNHPYRFLVIITLLCLQFSSAQNTLFSDYASNYGSWTNGSNAGTGFSTWDLWTQNTDATHFAGHFLGSSSGQGFGDINSSGTSFSMYANPSGTFVQANAQRFLTSTGSPAVGGRQYLLPGQSFKIDLAIAFRNGYKGIDLMDQNFGLLFNFNVGSDMYATTTNANLGWAYNQTSVFQLQVNQTGPKNAIFNERKPNVHVLERDQSVYGPRSLNMDQIKPESTIKRSIDSIYEQEEQRRN